MLSAAKNAQRECSEGESPDLPEDIGLVSCYHGAKSYYEGHVKEGLRRELRKEVEKYPRQTWLASVLPVGQLSSGQ
jgi:hypothetical protein